MDPSAAGLTIDSAVDTLPVSEYTGVDDQLECIRLRRQKMGWGVVKGVYRQGVVEPVERFPGQEGTEVFVLFPEHASKPHSHGVWQQIKREMAKEMPDLERQTMAEKRREFDRLSQRIAEQLPYDSPEELERAMRGDDYDLARH
jgi:hypothetical protein